MPSFASCIMRTPRRMAHLIGCLLLGSASCSGVTLTCASGGMEAAPAGKSRALIIVGLPGDAEHEKLFADTASKWRDWLTNSLDFEVAVLFGRSGRPQLATGDPEIHRECGCRPEEILEGRRSLVGFLS